MHKNAHELGAGEVRPMGALRVQQLEALGYIDAEEAAEHQEEEDPTGSYP